MPLDPDDVDVIDEETETTDEPEVEKAKKPSKKGGHEEMEEDEEEEAEEEKRKSVDEDEALTAHEVIKDIGTLAKELRDIVKMRAIQSNREKGNKGRMSKADVVKAAYMDPMAHLTEREFLALEKAATTLLPFFRRGNDEYPYPKGKKPPFFKPEVKKAEDDDFSTAEEPEAPEQVLSKADAEALKGFVNTTAPKMLEVLTALVDKK